MIVDDRDMVNESGDDNLICVGGSIAFCLLSTIPFRHDG